MRDLEPVAGRPVETELLRVLEHQPWHVDITPPWDVGGHDLCAPTLEFERPVTVERRDVEHPQSFERRGDRVVRQLFAMVDEAGGDHAVTEIDRVVPLPARDLLDQLAALGVERFGIRYDRGNGDRRQVDVDMTVAISIRVTVAVRAREAIERGLDHVAIHRVHPHAVGQFGRHCHRHIDGSEADTALTS